MGKEREAKQRREEAKEKARKQKEIEDEVKKKKEHEEAEAKKAKEEAASSEQMEASKAPEGPRRSSVTDMINKFESISNSSKTAVASVHHEIDAHKKGSHHQSHAHKNHNKKSQEARRQRKKHHNQNEREPTVADDESKEQSLEPAFSSACTSSQHQQQNDESLQLPLSPIDASVVQEGDSASEGGERRQSVQDLIDSFENILNTSPLAEVQDTKSSKSNSESQGNTLLVLANSGEESDDGVDDELRDADRSIDELRGMMAFDVNENTTEAAQASEASDITVQVNDPHDVSPGNQEEDRLWNERRRRSTLVVRDTGGGEGLFGEDVDEDVPVVPEHWQEFLDPESGNTFWHNMQTGASQWEIPTEGDNPGGEGEGQVDAAIQQHSSNNDGNSSDDDSDVDANLGNEMAELGTIVSDDVKMEDNNSGMTADQWRSRRRS